MQVIGITGSSGSGKTTISEMLAKRQDTKVINADNMAKKLTSSETEYLSEVKEAFQEQNILLENGSLNRAKLAELIYHNKQDLEKLNAITFRHLVPQIVKEIQTVSDYQKFVILDAPLLFEAGLDQYCDLTIAMQAPMDLKIRRICQRDKIQPQIAKARLEIQALDAFYVQKADVIIQNDETTTEEILQEKIQEILKFT